MSSADINTIHLTVSDAARVRAWPQQHVNIASGSLPISSSPHENAIHTLHALS